MSSRYVSLDRLNNTGAQYRVGYSQRSNGKTYAFKMLALNNYINSNRQFFYIRRRKSELKQKMLSRMFTDTPDAFNRMIHPRYPEYDDFAIKAREGEFRLYGMSGGKPEYIDTIGFYISIEAASTIKSIPFSEVNLIAFDEFMSSRVTGLELPNEYNDFINLISTIRRRRTDVVVYMLGNTVAQNSTYFDNWGIDVTSIRPGDVKVYEYSTGAKVAVEFFDVDTLPEDSAYTFGTAREQSIVSGVWETNAYRTYSTPPADAYPLGFRFEDRGRAFYMSFGNDRTPYISQRPLELVGYYYISELPTSRRSCVINECTRGGRAIIDYLIRAVNTNIILYDSWLTGEDVANYIAYKKRGR